MAAEQPSAKGSRLIRPVVIIAIIVALLGAAAFWPGSAVDRTDDGGKLRIVCTFLPVYVFTQNVVGDDPTVDVQLLLDRDVGCPHSYSLTGQDLKKISRASLVIANGLGAEPFLEQLHRGRRDLKVLTISDDCDVIHMDAAEAEADAQDEHAGHDHATGDHEGHDHAADGHADHASCDVNPHAWVSPRQAAKQVRTLARKLGQEDPARAQTYQANAEAYAGRLEALARKMEDAARQFTNRNIVTGHASFDYLARDLGLNVVATLRVIPGETGSAAEMAHVIDTVRKTKAAAVFWEPPFGDKVAETVARETRVAIYPLNPFNTASGISKPTTADQSRRMYEEVMIQNLATLQRALAPATSPANAS